MVAVRAVRGAVGAAAATATAAAAAAAAVSPGSAAAAAAAATTATATATATAAAAAAAVVVVVVDDTGAAAAWPAEELARARIRPVVRVRCAHPKLRFVVQHKLYSHGGSRRRKETI